MQGPVLFRVKTSLLLISCRCRCLLIVRVRARPLAAADGVAVLRLGSRRAGAGACRTPATGEATLSIFLRGARSGASRSTWRAPASDWVITSTGTLGAPSTWSTRFELKYAPDWQPIELQLDATAAIATQAERASRLDLVRPTTAINEITQNGVTDARPIRSPRARSSFRTTSSRLRGARGATRRSMTPGGELPVYVAPQGEIKVTVKARHAETFQTPAGSAATPGTSSSTFQNPARTARRRGDASTTRGRLRAARDARRRLWSSARISPASRRGSRPCATRPTPTSRSRPPASTSPAR